MNNLKHDFQVQLSAFVQDLTRIVTSDNGQWTVKGFIDTYKNIYTISADTKIVSKILEIHLFPHITQFAKQTGYAIVLPEHQNYYPDLSFVSKHDPQIKFAVDFKTTYRLPEYPDFCNGFTLGSHGEYFVNRTSTKNIQFPYAQYTGHFCLGIIYSRSSTPEFGEPLSLDDLQSITSVIGDFQFFVAEKWHIASDKSGSGNTANIGSISKIDDILQGNGMFRQLGESWFDDYWMNYGKITTKISDGTTKTITNLEDFVRYRGGNASLIVPKARRYKGKQKTA